VKASASSFRNTISTGSFGFPVSASKNSRVFKWRGPTCFRNCSSFSSASFVRALDSAIRTSAAFILLSASFWVRQ
jgi:hypothetical protein